MRAIKALCWLLVGVAPVALRAQDDAAIDSAYAAAQAGAWEASARAWRRVLDQAPNLAGAAVITLRGTGADSRSAIRRLFLAPPLSFGSRRALAGLEIDWGSPRDGWHALAPLPPNDTVVSIWVAFANDAEEDGDPLAARDALLAALRVHPSATLALQAAEAALAGGDAEGALALTERPELAQARDSGFYVHAVLPIRIRALARSGRAADAAALVTQYGDSVDTEIQAWLALYAGDLRKAREAVRHLQSMSPALVNAASLLYRTTADSAPDIGHAFLRLSHADTSGAADAFVSASASAALGDAAPLLLAMAARLHTAQHNDAQALPLWQEVVQRYATAPEAPEADLEWGRALKRQSNVPGAIERWEHLILTYPESALVPQARHELELVKAVS